jgi:hypothetical protein
MPGGVERAWTMGTSGTTKEDDSSRREMARWPTGRLLRRQQLILRRMGLVSPPPVGSG